MHRRVSTRVIFTFLVIIQLVLSFTTPNGVMAGATGNHKIRGERQAQEILNRSGIPTQAITSSWLANDPLQDDPSAISSPTQANLSISILSSPSAS
jgi:hypothetical protein